MQNETDNAAQTGPRRLRRSDDHKLGGVCGGIGEYFDVDPTLVRLGVVLGALIAAPVVLAYIVAWIVLPEPAPGAVDVPRADSSADGWTRNRMLWVAGLAALILIWQPLYIFGFGFGGLGFGLGLPLALLIVAALLFAGREAGSVGAAPPPPPTSPPGDPFVAGPGPAATTTAAAVDPNSAVAATSPADVPPPPPPLAPPAHPGPAPRPSRAPAPKSPILGPITLGLVATFIGAATVGDLADWWEIGFVVGFGVVLMIIGVALVVSLFVGRAVGLIPLGLFFVLAMLVSTAIDPIVRDGAGDRRHHVQHLDELEAEYRLGAGQIVLDLSDIELDGAVGVVNAGVGMGELNITVPDDVRVEVHTRLAAGAVEVFSLDVQGFDIERRDVFQEDATAGTLIIHLDVGAGYGEIRREARS